MDAPIKRMLKTTSSLEKGEEEGMEKSDSAKSSSNDQKHLCGVNSYNIGRPLVQMVHFVSSLTHTILLAIT